MLPSKKVNFEPCMCVRVEMYACVRRMYVCVRIEMYVCVRRMYVCESRNVCM